MPRKNKSYDAYTINAPTSGVSEAGASPQVLDGEFERAERARRERRIRADLDLGSASSSGGGGGLSISQIAAQTAGPLARTDAQSQRAARALPASDAVRSRPSGHQRKTLSAVKNASYRASSALARRTFETVATRSRTVHGVSNLLRQVNGDRTALSDKASRLVRRIDAVCQGQERDRKGNVIAYSNLGPTNQLGADLDQGRDRDTFLAHMQHMADSGKTLQVDGYIPSRLDPGELPTGSGQRPQVMLEIRTASGAYFGGSDTKTATTQYLVGRGRELRVTAVIRDAEVRLGDGSIVRRDIVQLDDVTRQGRSAAKST